MIEFGPYRLDAARRVVWRGEDLLRISPREAEILAALVERPGELVTKQELLALVWPGTFVEEANLSVNVSALRRVLGTRDDGGAYIQTVHRRGYRFVAPVRRAARTGPPVLAVLPFASLSALNEPGLGAGMADALITRLARTGRVIVRPTSSVLKYAGARDPLQAARDLAADAVLDGSLQRHGDRLRLSVQLVPMVESLRPWAAAFDEAYHDLFGVQEAVAEKVAAALALELTQAERERLREPPTRTLEAYEAYARGRHLWIQFSPTTLQNAFAAFQEAAERDPAYAAPHAGLADLYIVMGFSGLIEPREAWRLAGESAERALELQADCPEAHVARAYVRLFGDWDLAGTEAGLRRAVDLDPRSPAPHQWLGLVHAMLGRFDGFESELLAARALDPASSVLECMEAFLAQLTGDAARELTAARRAADLDPHRFLGQWSLGLALLRSGRQREAIAAHRRALALAEGAPLIRAVLARTLALSGRRDEARRLLSALSRLPSTSRYQLATLHLALGARARALVALEAAADARDPWIVWLRVDPMLAPLRREPRFRRLARRIFGKTTRAPSPAGHRSGAAPPRGRRGPGAPGGGLRSRPSS